MASLPRYQLRALDGSEWQGPSGEVDSVKRMSKRYAIEDDQEILQEGAGAILFPPKIGMFPEPAFY
jgi:hypothetical protein